MLRTLYVEDNEDNAYMLKMRLELTDEFELLVAEDGEKGSTISIVFVADEDPVTLGLMTSLARPSGNLTDINIFANELAAKRLELLREQVPEATRVAVLVNPANSATAETTSRDVASCCPRDRVASRGAR